ncbi:hypothetical protein [Burkholderia plantarii]|uniref:hypothetical protein n=1 Tax=Burkholderia plantarii TaxID=41899 RepID=UPI00114CDAEF|nr:hypothetical protein [Burkholderia plantarii]
MSAAKPKFFIASKYSNRIGYRKLNTFEERNPHIFALSRAAFETWDEAYAWVIETRKNSVDEARKNLKSAEAQLAKAKSMKKPESA